jgi:glycogen debranching enzyme
MDKMGNSMKAGNNGLPATPRDGSAIELVGLSRCVLDWLIKLNATSKYPYDGVVLGEGRKFTWIEWAKKIDENFEKFYWIDETSTASPHINKRNIYKDTLNSSVPWTDYQLRPNFLIALTVAPQMFNKEHARKSLEQCGLHLTNEPNTIGIKTLDDSDYNYCGFYDNANDSHDKRVAHGFNYHQGPEWLWPVGFYLRSMLFYFKDDNNANKRAEALALVKRHLGKLNGALNANDWKSLPELTNRNGEECHHSCPSQAWSVATILEVFYDLANY